MLKYFTFLLGLTLFAAGLRAEGASTINLGTAINLAGKQRMLSQRMGKAFIFKALLINPEQAEKDLTASVILFDENLKRLQEFSLNSKAMKKTYLKEETNWVAYKKLITGENNKTQALLIYKQATVLLQACQAFVKAVVSYVDNQTPKNKQEQTNHLAHIINISGRQRMLSQRLALLYGAHLLGQNEIGNELSDTFDDFDFKLAELKSDKINTPETQTALGDVAALWEILASNRHKLMDKTFPAEKLYELSASILAKMDCLTSVYEKLLL